MSAREWPIAALAARQHGVVAHRQLIELGLSPSSIGRRMAGGRLHRLHRGVYAVGHSQVTVHGRWTAALLACGPGALLSHRTAAALWDLSDGGSAAIEVTTPSRHRARHGVRPHYVPGLCAEDRARRDGLPVTSFARTLLDLAELLHPRQLERTVERAERLRVLDVRAIERVLERSAGRRGRRPLAEAIADQRGPPPDTRSALERRFLDLCEQAGLAPPAVNVVVAGFVVDAVWLEARVVVELDGYAFHRTRRTFEADRIRDAALQLAGYRVLRITHRRLDSEPAAVLETVRSLVTEGRARSATSSGR